MKSLTFYVQPFANILASLVEGSTPKECCYSGACQDQIIGVDPIGDIVPCGRFAGIDINIGNINRCSIQEALSSEVFLAYKSKKSSVEFGCIKCEHYSICHGGCPYSGYLISHDDFARDYYCEGYKIMFDHIKSFMRNELSVS